MDCIPPWLSATNQCSMNITTYNHTNREIYDLILNKNIRPRCTREPTEMEENCKKPCKKMTNKVYLIGDEESKLLDTDVWIRFKKTVRVEKKVVVYTLFNFIIDAGSSLGLWLGLSALGIIDLAIGAFMVAKKWLKV